MKSQKFISKMSLMVLSVITFHSASWVHAEEDSRPSREAMRAAFAACASTAGMEKPEAGQRPVAPTDEQKTAMDACLKSKGIQPPPKFGGGGGPRGPKPESEGVQ
ncbi:MAG: hypothetical protein ACKOX6_17955 [Bdellovibrio sp.]